MLPPAPGLFSITKGCLYRSERRCANVRAMMSVVPPAVKATTILTGFVGHACPHAESDAASASSAAAIFTMWSLEVRDRRIPKPPEGIALSDLNRLPLSSMKDRCTPEEWRARVD